MAEWKPGDIVRLKSGGPNMTVMGKAASSASSYICQWFVGTKLEAGTIHSDSLEAVEKDDEPNSFLMGRG